MSEKSKNKIRLAVLALLLLMLASAMPGLRKQFVARAADAPYTLVFDGTEYTPSTYYSTEYNVNPGGSLSLPFEVKGANKKDVTVYLAERYVVLDEDKSVASIKNGALEITNINYKTSYDLCAKDKDGNMIYIDIYVTCSTLSASVDGLGGLFSGMLYVPKGQSKVIEIDVAAGDPDGVIYYGYYEKKDGTSVSLGDGGKIAVSDGKITLNADNVTQPYEYYISVEDAHGNYIESKLQLDTVAVNPLPNKKIYDKYRTYYIDLARGEKTKVEIAVTPANGKYSVRWLKNGSAIAGETGNSLVISGDGSGWNSYYDAEVTELSSGKTVKCSFTVRNLDKDYVAGHELSLTVVNNETNPDITVTGIEDGGEYSGETTFTATCPEACMVLATTDGGETYTRLEATETDDKNTYSFTFTMEEGLQLVIAKAGDVDMDGLVNANDAMDILKYDVKKIVLDTLQKMLADVTEYGKINANDAMEILKKDVKKVTIAW